MRKLKLTSLLLAAVLLLPSLFACRSDKSENEDSPAENANTGTKTDATYETPDTQVKPSPDGNTQVVYAPSIENAGEISGELTQILSTDQSTSEVTAEPWVGYEFVRWSDGVTTPTRSGDKGEKGKITTLYAIFAPVYLEMPVIHLTTETGGDVTSKTEYIGGTISIANCKEEYALDDMNIEIRGRGNNSWTYDKKSYRIKLEEKQNLLGLGEKAHKAWNLIANHCDHTLLRNYTALKFADMMSGIAFSPDCISVEVYINGMYNGVYLLCEAIQVNSGRVDVSEDVESGTDIGYLLQLTNYAEEPQFRVGGRSYEIKNDLSQNEALAWEQMLYIQDYVDQCFTAVETGNRERIEELMDLNSIIDTYIVEETVKNLDVGWDSFYLYKDAGGKLALGPVWDFDLSLGNADESCDTYVDLYVAQNRISQSNPWFYNLMGYRWFRELVVERFTSDEVQEIIHSLPDLIRTAASENYASLCRNFEEWQIFGQKMNREPRPIVNLDNYDQHRDYLVEWLENRIAWLDGFIGSDRYNEGYNTETGGTIVNPNPTPTPDPSYEFTCSGGTGKENDPYLISTPADFHSFTKALLSGETFRGQYLKQTANLDMTDTDGYAGIGSSGNFAGIYDGNGYTIHANLTGNDQCIFPYLSGLVMNLGTTGSVNNAAQAAGICRSIRQGGGLINCYSQMAISSASGLAGGLSASTQAGDNVFLLNCYFAGSVDGGECSPSNVWQPGRGGNFGYLYSPDDLGAVNLSDTADILLPRDEMNSELADLLNTHRLDAAKAAQAYSVSMEELCTWESGETFPTLTHK